jgi:hypothetical protein
LKVFRHTSHSLISTLPIEFELRAKQREHKKIWNASATRSKRPSNSLKESGLLSIAVYPLQAL